MQQTLEERVLELERKVTALAAANLDKKRAWESTFGVSRDDPGFVELVRLGQEYRRNLNGADS
jgi:hypothetical protein